MEKSPQLCRDTFMKRVGNRPFYLLLDASYIKNLAATIYAKEFEPELEALYQGTTLENLMDVSPFLLKQRIDSPFFQWMITNIAPSHWGAVVVSHGSMMETAAHLKSLLSVRHSNNKAVYFRCYAPHILQALLDGATRSEFLSLMGVIKQIIFPVQFAYSPEFNQFRTLSAECGFEADGLKVYYATERSLVCQQAPWYQLSTVQQLFIAHAKAVHQQLECNVAEVNTLISYINTIVSDKNDLAAALKQNNSHATVHKGRLFSEQVA